MDPLYRLRVEHEKKELEDRLEKLGWFMERDCIWKLTDEPLFTSLPPRERARLRRQKAAMSEYLGILKERLEHDFK
jgi:DNA modification methylase